MTFFKLALRNMWRKPLRTLLLIASIAIAFLVFGILAAFRVGLVGEDANGTERLVVASAVGAGQFLPSAYRDRLETLDGVGSVAETLRIRGFVSTQTNIVVVSATDPGRAKAVFGEEYGFNDALMSGLERRRDAILVGRQLAAAQGWTIGESVAIESLGVKPAAGGAWTFNVAGIFEGKGSATDTYFAVGRYDYVNAARAGARDAVSTLAVVPAPGVDAAVLAPRIDSLFANSSAPTRTEAEGQFIAAFVRQVADINTIVALVTSAAFVSILMIVGNTMSLAIRERTFEIGMLKSLGLPRRRIFGLILSETFLVAVVGGLTGTLLASLATAFAEPGLGLVFTPRIFIWAFGLIVALALATGLLPALRAMRMPIVMTFKTR